MTGEGKYILIHFNSERKKVEKLNKDILQSISNRDLFKLHLLLNLTDEKRNKIKLKSKDVE